MQKKFTSPYLFILIALLILMSISRLTTETIRGRVVALLAPIWETTISLTTSFQPSSYTENDTQKTQLLSHEEIQRLELHNQLLTNELISTKRLLEDKKILDLSLQTLAPNDIQLLIPNYEKYIERLKIPLEFRMQALPARVIFRALDMWSHFLWINVGEANNIPGQMKIVTKYSPIVVGSSIVGIIDYVGKHQSRVCLITDPRLVPSVRVARGGEQDALINEHLEFLLDTLKQKKDLVIAETDRQTLIQLITTTKSNLQPMKRSWYLAKGEMQGSIRPSGRIPSQVIKGSGFNYDFADEEGESRDLRTGKLPHHIQGTAMPILKINDLLITTGMDGIFPPNLKVATITKIALLKEGDYFYEIEAKPTAENLNEISLVFVLPPLSYDKDELSTHTSHRP